MLKWVCVKVRARLYKLPFGYSFYIPKQDGVEVLERADWLVLSVGDYAFPARHHRKGKGFIVAVPRWARKWLEELILDGRLQVKQDVKILVYVIPRAKD